MSLAEGENLDLHFFFYSNVQIITLNHILMSLVWLAGYHFTFHFHSCLTYRTGVGRAPLQPLCFSGPILLSVYGTKFVSKAAEQSNCLSNETLLSLLKLKPVAIVVMTTTKLASMSFVPQLKAIQFFFHDVDQAVKNKLFRQTHPLHFCEQGVAVVPWLSSEKKD